MESNEKGKKKNQDDEDIMIISVVTRGTSPTPPPSLTAFTRTRRLEPIPKPVKREIRKSEYCKKIVQEQEQQTDRSDSSTSKERYSRYGGSSSGRIPWVSSYLEKFGANSTATQSSCTPRSSNNYGQQPQHGKTSSNYGYNYKEGSEQRSRSNSSSGLSRVDSNQKSKRSSSESTTSREPSPRVIELGHDQSNSRKDSSSSLSASKPNNVVMRSGSLKSRHVETTSSTVTTVNVPNSSGYKMNSKIASPTTNPVSSSSSSSFSSSSPATTVASSVTAAVSTTTKIKSADTTTSTSSSGGTSSSLPTSSVGNNINKSAGSLASSLVGSRQAATPDARKPPVPKLPQTDLTNGKQQILNNMSSIASNNTGLKYVNKDFRKSALNMENGDPSRSQKKSQRSQSTSSQDSSDPNKTSTRSSTKNQNHYHQHHHRQKNKKGYITRTISISTSECSSVASSSAESSNSEREEEEEEDNTNPKRNLKNKGRISRGSSKTSILASSNDELSIQMRPPPSPRSRNNSSSGGKNEEAKSFLMRALAPVTNLFKTSRQLENSADIKNGGWADAMSEENSDSGKNISKRSTSKSPINLSENSVSFVNLEKSTRETLRHQSSEEKPWWLDPNSDNVPEGVERNQSIGNDDVSQDTTISTTLPDDGNILITRYIIKCYFTKIKTVIKY